MSCISVANQSCLTADEARRLLSYDPKTGEFVWLVATAIRTKVGAVAGRNGTNGYREISIFSKKYKAHRVAWLISHGEWPRGYVDHINGDRLDNRLANLRIASTSENLQNLRKACRNNESGYLGVSRIKLSGKWVARIRINYARIHIGTFNDPETAYAAYLAKKREIHIGCTL